MRKTEAQKATGADNTVSALSDIEDRTCMGRLQDFLWELLDEENGADVKSDEEKYKQKGATLSSGNLRTEVASKNWTE